MIKKFNALERAKLTHELIELVFRDKYRRECLMGMTEYTTLSVGEKEAIAKSRSEEISLDILMVSYEEYFQNDTFVKGCRDVVDLVEEHGCSIQTVLQYAGILVE